MSNIETIDRETRQLINYSNELENREEILYLGYYYNKETKDNLFNYTPYNKEKYYTLEKATQMIKTDRINNVNKLEIEKIVDNILNLHNDIDNNCFLQCIKRDHENVFYNQLFKENKVVPIYRNIAKDLLIDCVRIFKTPYKEEYYIQKEDHFIYIGDEFKKYLEKLYNRIPSMIKEIITFNSIKSKIGKLCVDDTLEPNRDYILFDDCLLNINNGETYKPNEITIDKIPFAIMNTEYLKKDKEVFTMIHKELDNIGNKEIILSMLYSLFNKRTLERGAFFNIQPTKSGKSVLVRPFVECGLMRKFSSIPKGNDEVEIYKQYYSVVFDEVQDEVLDGAKFNNIIDNSPITLPRKYKNAITIPTKLKPNIVFNGENMPIFKGKTQGSNKRSYFIPKYENKISEEYGKNSHDNYLAYATELLRILINYKLEVGISTISDNIQSCKKTNSEIIDLKESKIKILLEYIREEPTLLNAIDTYCISIEILSNMIKRLQDDNIITVNLFTSDESIKQFIKNSLMNNIEYPNSLTYIEPKSKRVKYIDGGSKVMRLNPKFQLTKKGIEFVTKLGYEYTSLII